MIQSGLNIWHILCFVLFYFKKKNKVFPKTQCLGRPLLLHPRLRPLPRGAKGEKSERKIEVDGTDPDPRTEETDHPEKDDPGDLFSTEKIVVD